MEALLALADGLLVVSLDDGRTTELLLDHRPECVAPTDGAVLVGTLDDGLWRATTPAPGSFDRVAAASLPDRDTALAAAPSDPTAVYLGTEPSTVHRSTDGGRTWTACATLTDLPSADEWSFPPRPDTHHVRTLAVHPADPDRLSVGIEAGALVRSDDGGESWTERPPGSRRDNHALATHPDAPDRVYAAAGDGYAESRGAGATWDHPTDGLQHGYVWGLAVDPADPDRRYVSAARGAYAAHRPDSANAHVYRRDGEEPWQRFDGEALGDGLPVGEGVCRAVLAAPAPDELLAATNRGLFHSRDAGASFERVVEGDGWDAPRALASL